MEEKFRKKFLNNIKALVGLDYKTKEHALDDIVFFYLKILSDIFEDTISVENISKHLSIDLEIEKNITKIAILKKQLFFVEQKLDKKLQGFSRLLNDILQDYSFVPDKKFHMKKLRFINNSLKENIIEISNSLDVYTELNNVFLLNDVTAHPMIFLLGINDYIANPIFIHKWLFQKKKKIIFGDMFSKYEHITEERMLNYCLVSKEYAKSFLIVWLCRRISLDGLINSQEAFDLKNTINKLKIFNFNQLVELGFICLDEDEKENLPKNVLKIANFY